MTNEKNQRKKNLKNIKYESYCIKVVGIMNYVN